MSHFVHVDNEKKTESMVRSVPIIMVDCLDSRAVAYKTQGMSHFAHVDNEKKTESMVHVDRTEHEELVSSCFD